MGEVGPEQEGTQCAEEAAGTQEGGGAEAGQPGKPAAVQLMTVHQSKGLEFDTVVVTGCEDGIFPILMQDTTDDDIDEERRLMCVSLCSSVFSSVGVRDT